MSRNKRVNFYKVVTWYCDKVGCKYLNYRHIKLSEIIRDDKCDRCEKRIHEPLTTELQPNQKHDKRNND